MPATVAQRLCAAINAHDLDAFADCFAEDYDSRQPAHPDRAFRGREQARLNWSAIFEGVPDLRAELVREDTAADVEWSEWSMHGTHRDGGALELAGVIVAGVEHGRLAWARLYLEPVEQAGAGIQTAVRAIAGD